MGTISPPPGNEKPKSYGLTLLFGGVFLVMGLLIVNGLLRNRKPEETPASSPAAAPEKAPAEPEAASTAAPPAATPAAPAKQESPLEMAGWGSFRWGMTPEEAEKAIVASGFSVVERKTNKDGEPLVGLSDHKLAGVTLTPTLRLTPNLTQVGLLCPKESATLSVYEMLKKHLTDTYGVPPTSKKGIESASGDGLVGFKGLYIRDDTWSFPKTTVNLMFMGSAEKPDNVLMLVFRDPQSMPETSFIPEGR